MVNPIKSFKISGSCAASQDLVVELTTSAGVRRGRLVVTGDSNSRYSCDLVSISSSWVVGDKVVVIQRGGVNIGGGSGTIASTDAGGKTINVTSGAIAFPSTSM